MFSFLYPIGIPVGVGIIIFRHREEIKSGVGPSQFERLYHDYKPEHCRAEIGISLWRILMCGMIVFMVSYFNILQHDYQRTWLRTPPQPKSLTTPKPHPNLRAAAE